MRVKDIPFAAIDFESAGSEAGRTDEPIQIGIAHLSGTEISLHLASYLTPQKPVIWSARAIHGIQDKDLIGAPRLKELWPEVKNALQGRWVVAHGAGTERRFLRTFPFHGFGPWLDTLVLARAVYPTLKSHALGDVISALGLDKEPEIFNKDFRWHDASCDVVACLVLLRHLIQVNDLADAPATIFKDANLQAYFSLRKGKSPVG